jgi:hypothetical protein
MRVERSSDSALPKARGLKLNGSADSAYPWKHCCRLHWQSEIISWVASDRPEIVNFMRPVAPNERIDAPLGIRNGVWLTALGLLFLCVLAISLSHRHSSRPRGENASGSERATGQNSATSSRNNARQPAHKGSEFEFVNESRGRLPATLSAEEARSLARRIANEKAKELYGCEPFTDWALASLDETGWFWSSRRAHGHGDLEATVRFAADGSKESVDVFLLDLSSEGSMW